MFETFYNLYPRRINRHMAEKSFNKALKVTDAQTIINAAIEYSKWVERTGTEKQFICHPATWINQHRYENDYASMDTEPSPQRLRSERPRGGANAVDAAFFNIMQQMER